MPSPRLTASLLAALLLAGQAHAAPGPVAAQRELDVIHALAERSPKGALGRLAALQAALGDDAPYPLRQRLLRTEAWLHEDAGELDASYAAERKSYDLARAHGDRAGAARARLGEVKRLLDQGRPADAHRLLDQVRAETPADAPIALQVAFARSEGDVFNVEAAFDKALAAYLRALELLLGAAGEGGQRALLHARIAQVYINTEHPQKALETTARGLLESGVPTPTACLLQFSEGIALIRLNRGGEGIAALERALRSAERGGLVGQVASIRGNIADYFLRQHDYARAEREARAALAASNRVKDQTLVTMARANLGFALMGQGRIAEGGPHVDAVIAQTRAAGAAADLEALLDEKGQMLERAGLYRDALAAVRDRQTLQQHSARVARDQAIAALQEQFDASQRTRQIELLRRENQLKDAELSSRRTAQIATTFASVLTVLAGAAVYLLYRRTARSNARLQQLNAQLEYHSTRDALTGLHNRRSFLERMRARADRADGERRGAPGVDCFVLMDIDHFKSVNDRWGHAAGDAVLVEVARRLIASVRDSDMVLRWGGEEFMIHSPGIAPGAIAELVKRVLHAIGSTPVATGSCAVPVTVTAGVVALPLEGAGDLDWERALRLADWALYQGKSEGRNQARVVTRLRAPVDAVMAGLDGVAADAGHAAPLDMVRIDGPAAAA